MRQASCLYLGEVRHRRLAPRVRSFEHQIGMAYIDLDELPSLLGGRLVRASPGLLRFRRRDYHGDPSTALDTAVRGTVERRLGRRPTGPVRVLTHLRTYGHCFNPVSFYYCLRDDANTVDAVLAEVTNTPWGERHAYVIDGENGSFTKAMHVSPFMPMDQTYSCRAPLPGDRLDVEITNTQDGATMFEAGISLSREELTAAAARRFTGRYPLATVRVLGLIYAHALGIRMSGVRVVPHPRKLQRCARQPEEG